MVPPGLLGQCGAAGVLSLQSRRPAPAAGLPATCPAGAGGTAGARGGCQAGSRTSPRHLAASDVTGHRWGPKCHPGF